MKLVDILARDLKCWPYNIELIEQSDSGKIYDSIVDIDYWKSITVYELSEDFSSTKITRAEWQAAVDALNADKCEHSYANNIGCPECGELNAPKVVEWDGAGLPPVGIVCETSQKEIVRILTHVDQKCGQTLAVGQYGERGQITLATADSGVFRPVRTAEQVAAEEREKAIKEMMQHGVDAGDSTIEYSCAALYDAGYRKEPKPCGP